MASWLKGNYGANFTRFAGGTHYRAAFSFFERVEE